MAKQTNFKSITKSFYQTTDGDHARVEVRKYWTVDDIDWLDEKAQWKGLTSIGMVEATRYMGDKTSTETRFYIS